MTYDACIEQMSLNHDILAHQTYKESKIKGLYIIPEMHNVKEMLSQALYGQFNLAAYKSLPLNVYAVYNCRDLKDGSKDFDFEKLEIVLENLDDNSW